MKIETYSFEELSNVQLYAVLRLRSEVFVVEQACAYQDIDDLDESALHLCVWDDKGAELLAYTRLIAPDVKHAEASITRVVVSPKARGKGLARKMMEASLAAIEERWGRGSIRIEAQSYLKDFYEGLGFRVLEAIDLDGIPHYEMLREDSVG